MNVLYEDNHIIIVNKQAGEIVQGDKTGDTPLVDTVRQYVKEKHGKPGNVFCGVVHRLDRPVSGTVIFAKTSKALSRLNEMFRNGKVHKTYWALTRHLPTPTQSRLIHYITSTEKTNKSTAHLHPVSGAKEARLSYKYIKSTDSFHLVEIELETGRKHQIRVQLAAIGCPIRGDLKYGDRRSNPDGSISLHARHIEFIHPVSKLPISITAPVPQHDAAWKSLDNE